MLIKNLLIVAVLLQFLAGNVNSQGSLELELVYSPAMAQLGFDFSEPALYHSYGVEVKRTFKSRLYIKGGAYLRKLGARFQAPANVIAPRPFKIKYITTSIDLPVKVGYIILSGKKLKVGIDFGIESSFLLKQQAKRLGEKVNIGVYNKFLLAFVSNLEIGYILDSKWSIYFGPSWFQQINENKTTYEQLSLGLSLGVAYNFN